MAGRLGTLQNKPLRERVVEILRDAILSAELKPGQALIETELAAQLGISRAPLREALQQLNAEGLIEMVPYHGASVKSLTLSDIEELYSLRMLLETFAARRIIERNDAAAAATLRDVFERMLAASETGDVRQVSVIDREFHDALISLSEHSLLQSTWSVVSLRVRQVMALRNRRNSDIRQIAYNHLPIIEAIEGQNAAEAVRLLETHIASAGDLVAEGWDSFLKEITPS
jgi:DNA-binding GntR family transcriptional regulator